MFLGVSKSHNRMMEDDAKNGVKENDKNFN